MDPVAWPASFISAVRRSLRARMALFFALLAVAATALIAGAMVLAAGAIAERGAGQAGGLLALYGGGAALAIIAAVAAVGFLFDGNVASPIQGLARDLQTVMHGNPAHRIDMQQARHLGLLPDTLRDMAARLAAARSETEARVAAATAAMQEQKGRLEALLRDLHEGVVLCNLNHQVLLYNARALNLLHLAGEIGLGRSLFSVMNRQPVFHALERLTNRLHDGRHETHPQGLTAPFVCSTTDGRYTLEGQMSLVLGADGEPSGYVITFEDVTRELAALGKRDHLLRRATEGLRAPVANLRAAAETLATFDDLQPEARKAFQDVVASESRKLSDQLESLAGEYRSVITGHWPMADVYSANLLNLVVRRLRDEKRVHAVMTGLPAWLYGDSHSLAEALHYLVGKVHDHTGATSIDLEAEAGEERVSIDIVWDGEAVPSSVVDGWLEGRLEGATGGLSLRDVLEHHKGELWSQPRDGRARLRMPLLPATRGAEAARGAGQPARPEFYDFGLLEASVPVHGATTPLSKLSYVVFDTETTGLHPSAGDEMISIAGVRIVNGRLLTGESFSRLIDPGRPIPKASIRFHGITEQMVQDKPPAQVVLPQFHQFVGDAILVAHNAAFDMKFLKLKEAEAGVKFENTVLDTLLLSAWLHDHTPRHTLDDLAERFGIRIEGRHTALGDALTTAAVFLRMIEMLEARGVHTLADAIAASNEIVEIRAAQAQF